MATMTDQSPVFEETCRNYLHQIGEIDYLAKAELLGLAIRGDSLVVPLFDRRYLVSPEGIVPLDSAEEPTPAVKVIVSKYVLHCREPFVEGDDPYRSFRDFRDSSPLISYFTANTNKTIEATFTGKLEQLIAACVELGGVVGENLSYDCSILISALPKVGIVLNFNDRDELFPASCSILYRASAEEYLDMECLAMTGTLLAGRLIRSVSH